MKAKLKIELTVRVEEDGEVKMADLRDLVREYLKKDKFMINNISFIATYRDEEIQNDNSPNTD